MTDYVRSLDVVRDYLTGCDHYDSKTIDSDVTLREFLAGMLSYYPAWIKLLYGIRWGFVRVLGMKQENLPTTPRLAPEDIHFEPGADATIFTVKQGVEDHYWLAGATEKHLSAYLMVAVEPLDGRQNRFHVATIVHYHHWTGPVYFNVIRPFHHLVVGAMMRAGAANTTHGQAVRYA